mgnify:FL=1
MYLSFAGYFGRGRDKHGTIRLVDGGLLQLKKSQFHRFLRRLIVVVTLLTKITILAHPAKQTVLTDIHPIFVVIF